MNPNVWTWAQARRVVWPLGAGLAGVALLAAVYLGLVTWAQGLSHALQLLWEDRFIVTPILLGFGVQAALYTILKKRLYLPVANAGPSGPLLGASGATSTAAMAACCAHHIADVLPLLGLTAAATFLAQYRIPFMLIGLTTTLAGIAVMLTILFRERRRVLQPVSEVQR